MKNKQFVDFKKFLVTEGVKTGTGPEYFSMKIGDLITSLQKLSRDVAHMGSRTTTNILKDITDAIRVILNDKWDESIRSKLPKVQKIGVALAKLIDEGGEIPGTIVSAQAELEQMVSKLGNPLYSTGGGEETEE